MRGEVFLCAILIPCLTMGELGKDPVLGGWSKVKDLTSPLVESIALQALKMSGEGERLGKAVRVSDVLSASRQVVSGMNYRLVVLVSQLNCTEAQSQLVLKTCQVEMASICFFELYSQPWTLTNELTNKLCLRFVPVLPDSMLEVLKKWINVTPNSESVQTFASKAVELLGGSSYKLELVLKSRMKVTLDKHLDLKFEAIIKANPCIDGVLIRGVPVYCERFLCNLELQVDLWTSAQSLISKKCKVHNSPPVFPPTTGNPVTPGAFFPIDRNSTEAKEVVERSMRTYETEQKVKVSQYFVIEMSGQVVEGMNYKIRLAIRDCPLDNSRPCSLKLCTFDVFTRPWTNTFTLTPNCSGGV